MNLDNFDTRIHEFFVRLFGISALVLFVAVCVLPDGEVECLALSAMAMSFGLWLFLGPVWNGVMFLAWFVFGIGRNRLGDELRLFGISAFFLFIAVCLLPDGEVESLAFSAMALSFGLWLTCSSYFCTIPTPEKESD